MFSAFIQSFLAQLPLTHKPSSQPLNPATITTELTPDTMSSDKARIAELEAQLAQTQSALGEKNETLKITNKRLAASVKQSREKDTELSKLKEELANAKEGEACHHRAHKIIETYRKDIDELTTQLVTYLRI